MWRTVFALAHADGVVSKEEVRYMAEILEDMPFTESQRKILKDDSVNAKDIVEMFEGISDAMDQARFFKFAQELVWIDGDYGKEEQDIMLRLKEVHLSKTNVDDLIGKVELEFDDGKREPAEKKSAREIIFSFRDQFFKDRFNEKAK